MEAAKSVLIRINNGETNQKGIATTIDAIKKIQKYLVVKFKNNLELDFVFSRNGYTAFERKRGRAIKKSKNL